MSEIQQLDKIVIRFSKALDLNLIQDGLPFLDNVKQLGGPWMTLGYFDAMQIYSLPNCDNQSWLKAVWNHNIKLSEGLNGRHYIHPFHIMVDAPISTSGNRYKEFWTRESNCLFVTLAQGIPQDNTTGVYSKDLEQKICNLLENRDTDSVSYIFYHTLELSDLVILWKADSMAEILACMQMLYFQPFIGDLNTFCGISYTALERKSNIQHDQAAIGPIIPRVSMRFLVRDAQKPPKVFTELKKYFEQEPYFVTGTEDLHVIWTDIPEWTFYRILHRCFLQESDNSEFRQLIQNAFREMETHVGMRATCPPYRNKSDLLKTSKLTQKCQKLFDLFSAIVPTARNQENECDYSWMKAVRNQLNEMLDMSQSYVVDGLCYLALDSVTLFCDEMSGLLSSIEPLTSQQVKGILRFVRGWGILMEQAGRADGRFTRLPGFSPPLYDIPSSLLEFYLAFTKLCGRILQTGGQDMNRFAMLIVPKLCRRIKVESVLNFKDPPCPRLLYVDIPLDTLYDPFTVLCQLVHEISHFCGEYWRKRAERTNYYLAIGAYELAVALGMETKQTIQAIRDDLNRECPQKEYYLLDKQWTVSEAMLRLVKDERTFGRWMEVCEKSLHFEEPWHQYEWKSWCVSHRAILLSSYSNGALYQIMNQVRELFQECYADVSMICTLDLHLNDYLNLAANELRLYSKWLETTPNDPTKLEQPDAYMMIVQRWAAVCSAAFGNILQQNPPQTKHLSAFFQHICKCVTYVFEENGDPNDNSDQYYLNAVTLKFLIQYLQLCHSDMKNNFPISNADQMQLEKLRIAFKSIACEQKSEFGCRNSLVADYEEMLLK